MNFSWQRRKAAENREQPPAGLLEVALSAGTQLVVSVLVGVLAGRWLDSRFGTAPWLLLSGAFAGISFGLYNLVRQSYRLQRRP